MSRVMWWLLEDREVPRFYWYIVCFFSGWKISELLPWEKIGL